MKIRIVGLNHKTAPVAVRENLAFNAEQVAGALEHLQAEFPEAEFVLLSTCNRTELYYAARGEKLPANEALNVFFNEYCSIPLENYQRYLYFYKDEEAVRHLLNVISSLDSLVVGEAQIIAQVKESYRLANGLGCTGKVLNRLFHCAFATSKEVHTMTSIGQRRVSVAGAAIDLAKKLFQDLASARVAVIGAGEMGELLIQHLMDIGCQNITVYNRTFQRARNIAAKYKITAQPWVHLETALKTVDIVVAAALAEEYLFDKSFLTGREGGPLMIIDIAVPRNFDPAVDDLSDVHLYSVDDLADVVQENMTARQEDIGEAREIINDNVTSFMDWFGVMDIGPLIGKLRRQFQTMSMQEFEKCLAGQGHFPGPLKHKMEAAVNRITNKLVHRLINNMYTVAKTHGPQEAQHLILSIIDEQGTHECGSECEHKCKK